MKTNLNESPIYILPHSSYDGVLKELNAARASGRTLHTACELLIEKLKGMATLSTIGELVPGKRYGYLAVSSSATAERNGRMIPNHGEIYLYTATLQAAFDSHPATLVSRTAWGADHVKSVRPGMLLIEC